MRKTLVKNIDSKPRTANPGKLKSSAADKKNSLVNLTGKKTSRGLLQVLSYQYQDSDLEQFVF